MIARAPRRRSCTEAQRIWLVLVLGTLASFDQFCEARPGLPTKRSLARHASRKEAPEQQQAPSSSASSPFCGDGWQQEYAALHRAIEAGESQPRYAIATTSTGLADALTGGVSVFLYALLSRRAFKWHLQAKPGIPDHLQARLEWGYAQPNINWTWDGGLPPVFSSSIEDENLSLKTLRLITDPKAQDTLQAQSWWRAKNLTSLGEGFTYVHVNASRGMSFDLFANPHHTSQLYSMGLRPDTAFGCVLQFLVALHPDIESEHAEVLAAMSNPQVLKVGIQVRVGDQVLRDQEGQALKMSLFAAFFDCALEVERTRGDGYPAGVRWYLSTDSNSLRAHAAEQFRDKLVGAGDGVVVGHIAEPALRGGHSVRAVFQGAVLENWLLGMTDVQIITLVSGFGRTAAFRSLRWQSLYTMNWGDKKGMRGSSVPRRKCGIYDYDHIEEVAHHWSHI